MEISAEKMTAIDNLFESTATTATTATTEQVTTDEVTAPADTNKPIESESAKDESEWGKNFRALTKKEKAIRDRELALKEKEAKITESEKHWNEVNTLIQSDPLSGLEKLGIDYNALTSLIVKKTIGGDTKQITQDDIDSLVEEKLTKKEQERLEAAVKEKESQVEKQLSEDRVYIGDMLTQNETTYPYLAILADMRGSDLVAQAIQDFMIAKYEESGNKTVPSYNEAFDEVEKAAKDKFGPSFEKRFGIKSQSPEQANNNKQSAPKAPIASAKTLTNNLSAASTEKKPLSREEKIRMLKDKGW